jgi:hypothetical protein
VPSSNTTRTEVPNSKPRFSWPMRLFLAYFLFDMVTRGLILLTPADDDWFDELAMESNPLALPSRDELRQCASGENPDYDSKWQRYVASFKSASRFLVPVPEKETREKITSAADVGKYTLTWLGSRQAFIGRMVGVDQNWPMFSPNVGDDDTMGRLLLIYEDGAQQEYHLLCDPEDLTSYSHWFQEKRLQTETKVHRDEAVRLGFCQMLARRQPRNEKGSPLVRIQVFKVTYHYPSPYENAKEVLRQQTGPPAEQTEPVFWEYDVASGAGRSLQ